MIASECTFILPGGNKCRASARRGQPFCRHHPPASAVPIPPSIPKDECWSRHRRWITVSRELSLLHPSELPGEILLILYALLQDGEEGISDRVAGRLLRVLLRRIGSVPFPFPDPPQLPGLDPGTQTDTESDIPPAPPGFDPEALAGRKYDPRLLNHLLGSLGIAERVPEHPELLQMRPDPGHMRPHLLRPLPSSTQRAGHAQ